MAVSFFDSWDVVDHVRCARTNRNSCDFSAKAEERLSSNQKIKTVISPTRNLHFGVLFKAPN